MSSTIPSPQQQQQQSHLDMSVSMIEIEDFLNGTLISWLESCLPRPDILANYSSLLDGHIYHSVWLQIDPEPQYHLLKLIGLDGQSLANARAKNFDSIVKNLRALYEDELGQTVLVLPNCSILGHFPESRSGLEQMKLLLTLLLGAAVQCPNKELFIGRIKELEVDIQCAIVELIKQVTDNQSLVMTNDTVDNQINTTHMLAHLMRLAKERDQFHSNWIASLPIETEQSTNGLSATMQKSNSNSSSSTPTTSSSISSTSDSNHMAVELADMKSKLRKLRQDLEEKSEAYMEVKEELDHKTNQYEKLRNESHDWYTEARRAATYRDEVDVLRERADRADRLEVEIQRFREKLSDAEFYKTRVEELREDNRMLLETKEMLEEQLQRSRKRSEHAMVLESEILKYKQKLNDMALELDSDKAKIQELLEENTQLQLTTKTLTAPQTDEALHSDQEGDCTSGDNSLSEQLTNNAQSRALKLELENRRLLASLDAMKESTFHETANKILEFEKDKKKFTLKIDQLQDNCNRLCQQNQELDEVFKNALEENRKLQNALDARQQANDRQTQEREVDRIKIIDFEKTIETLTKEKQRIQNLNESIQRRAEDLERTLDSKSKDIEHLQLKETELEKVKNESYEITSKLNIIEKENNYLSKEVIKLKESLEIKDVLLDTNATQIESQSKELQRLIKEVEDTGAITSKVHELEIQNQELLSQNNINIETISTLQKDLISGTLATKKVIQGLEKLGLEDTEIDNIDLNVETVVEKLVKNPDTFKTVREIMLNCSKEMSSSGICVVCHRKEVFTVEKDIEISNECDGDTVLKQTEEVLSSVSAQWKEQCDQLLLENTALQTTNEMLQGENARQKVDVSTLGSQVTSLNKQHVALQLANSQLATEKDVLVRNLDEIKTKHQSLLNDQITMQCLHEHLSAEYDTQNKEKEILKATLRDLKTENRDLRERQTALENVIKELELSIDASKRDSISLGNLRAEHSKLKDDFRNLFSTNERLKQEYKNIQEQYRAIRTENSSLKLQKTELTGELNNRIDQSTTFEIDLSKVTQRCEMLLQMNANLDIDRRTLMDHVSQLLSQYHELLAHSLDDKQHYHDEEKQFTDKVNNLYRQKEKLEEKIMEHYRKLESCSPKKKQGTGYMKRMKKACTDLIKRVPNTNNRRSWIDDSRLTQSQLFGSESGGNESDNSIEEPNSVASDTNLLHRNTHLRQSLQRKQSNQFDTLLTRGGVRSSLQSIRREDNNRANRNSFHGLDPPDVTSTSLNLGTAGSRRTVYLVDDNQKLSDSQDTTSINRSETPTPTNNTTNDNSNSSTSPSTILMYNRISTIVGEPSNVGNAETLSNNSLSNIDQSGSNASFQSGGSNKKPNDKEPAVWYEYGCV